MGGKTKNKKSKENTWQIFKFCILTVNIYLNDLDVLFLSQKIRLVYRKDAGWFLWFVIMSHDRDKNNDVSTSKINFWYICVSWMWYMQEIIFVVCWEYIIIYFFNDIYRKLVIGCREYHQTLNARIRHKRKRQSF